MCQQGRWVPKEGGLRGLTSIGKGNVCQQGRWPEGVDWVWKSLSSRCVLKTLKGSLKGKAQRGQYLLAMGLGSYNYGLISSYHRTHKQKTLESSKVLIEV